MEKQAAGGRRVLLGRNLSQNRESLCEKALLAHIKTVFAKLGGHILSPVEAVQETVYGKQSLSHRDSPNLLQRISAQQDTPAPCRLLLHALRMPDVDLTRNVNVR